MEQVVQNNRQNRRIQNQPTVSVFLTLTQIYS